MSDQLTAVKVAIRTLLVADTEYLSLLGSPSAPPWNTHYMRPPTEPSFPQVVYWLGAADYDQAFAPSLLSSNHTLTFRTYSRGAASNQLVYEELATRIKVVMHNAVSSGFRAFIAAENELYEEAWDVYSKALTFDLRYRRATL